MALDTGATAVPSIAALRRLLPAAAARGGAARCDLCSQPLGERHDHLLELATRELRCACTACALLFDGGGTIQPGWRRLPRDGRHLAGLELTGAEWASLGIPIQLAFLTTNSLNGRVLAAYPSPAGAVSAEIEAEVWQQLASDHIELASLAADVEALLLDRMSEPRGCYIIPLDEAYRLTGLIRQSWTGFTGGPGVKRAVAEFTRELRHA